jgi:hypothetical protein
MLKPYYRLNIPFPKENFLAESFKLPKTVYDHTNPYIPPDCDVHGRPLTCENHNVWVHRFAGDIPGTKNISVTDVFSNEFINFFENRGHKIGAVFIFHARPGMSDGTIHADWGPIAGGPRNYWAVNWTMGAKEHHYMKWYEPRRSELDSKGWPIDAGLCLTSYPIPRWTQRNVVEIDRYNITEATLVRTDIPHNAVNTATEARWCFSIRANKSASWEEAVDWFKDIIIE